MLSGEWDVGGTDLDLALGISVFLLAANVCCCGLQQVFCDEFQLFPYIMQMERILQVKFITHLVAQHFFSFSAVCYISSIT